MSFNVDTNHIALFGGDYYARAQISYTQNVAARTFTVTIDGVRGYSSRGYDFNQYIEVFLNSSNTSVNATTGSGTIPGSGSNTYTGWMPRDGLYTGARISRTFYYNTDGTVPAVWVYLRAYNNNVKWLSQGSYVAVNVSTTTNISSNISRISPVGPTSVTLSRIDYDARSISWQAIANSNATNYELYIDGTRVTSGTMSGTRRSGTNTVFSAVHTLYVRMKNGSSSWITSNTISADCTIPSINNPSIIVDSYNSGILSFKSNYDVQYLLDNVVLGSVYENSDPFKSVNLKSNSISNYVLQVRRLDNTKISNSVTISANTRIANITLQGTAQGTTFQYTATSNYECNNWTYFVLGSISEVVQSGTITTNTTNRVTGVISGLNPNTQYIINIYATTTGSGLRAGASMTFTTQGNANIFDGNSFKVATPYVFNGSQWIQVVPYVFDGTSWKISI